MQGIFIAALNIGNGGGFAYPPFGSEPAPRFGFPQRRDRTGDFWDLPVHNCLRPRKSSLAPFPQPGDLRTSQAINTAAISTPTEARPSTGPSVDSGYRPA